MKTVGFLGGYDKSDLLLYIARILTLADKKVLVVDTSLCQRLQYIVPTISPTKSYVTEFEGFDVAVGFKSMNEIKGYLGTDDIQSLYDIVLLDIDDGEIAQNFQVERNYKNCFVTAFDLYSLKKGVEILQVFNKPVKISKVLFSQDSLKEENEYLEYLSLGYKISWDKEIYSFPIEPGNYSVMIENQIISRIKIKRLSTQYKNNLCYFISMIFEEDITEAKAKKIIKTMERE